MLEITNRMKSPVQIIVKSRTKSRSMTVKNVPGVGSGKNKIFLEEEIATDYIQRLEREKMISVRKV